MLRVLTLSSLYPNPVQPTLGGFVARQTEMLAARRDVEVEVIAPIQRFPLDMPRMPYRHLATIPTQEVRGDVMVHHPRYVSAPVIGWRTNPDRISDAAVSLARSLHAEKPFDVIDCEYFFPDSVAALALSRALGLP